MHVLIGSKIVFSKVIKADHPWTRMRGLLGRRSLDPEEGLLIIPCRQVHMFFMKFDIDLVFLDRQMVVIQFMTLKPGQVSTHVKTAHAVLEVAAGSANKQQIAVGDRLIFR